jgi:hypothetical protein
MFDVFYYGPKPGLFAFEQPAESLEHAASLSRTSHYWYIYGGNDYTGFDFEYQPVPWETEHLHTWPSQWQRTGGVYLANRHTVNQHQYNFHSNCVVRRLPDKTVWRIPIGIDDSEFDYSWHPDETEADYEYHFGTQWQRDGGPVYPGRAGIKYMGNQRIRSNATQIFYMDFLNPHSQKQFETLKQKWPDIRSTRYVDSHLNVFRRIMNLATTEYVWITSSICDYGNFDFTWHPEPHQREMIHCFPSGSQDRGDTFYIHVPSFTQQMIDLEMLDWFNVINYCNDQTVFRFDTPIHRYDSDNLIEEIKQYDFQTPYVMFTNQPDLYISNSACLWTRKDRVVLRCSASGATAIVPRDIKADLKSQIYDYPYIEASVHQVNDYIGDKKHAQLDIVYISNGEPDEQRWYEHACYMSNSDVKWIRGINGRTAAYQAAARASDTPWFFAVFAKLEVLGNQFDWWWMPDYFQQPKHYIFNARNPLNGLEYGHQGMIAYNKQLVLANTNPGIDFTLSQPHESVPILSGTAHFNQDAWMTWRTAFREVLKLKHFMATQPTLETSHRLATWCTVAEGNHAEWCLRGANDAVLYYNQVDGDYEKLKLSFDWAWLQERFNAGKQ